MDVGGVPYLMPTPMKVWCFRKLWIKNKNDQQHHCPITRNILSWVAQLKLSFQLMLLNYSTVKLSCIMCKVIKISRKRRDDADSHINVSLSLKSILYFSNSELINFLQVWNSSSVISFVLRLIIELSFYGFCHPCFFKYK